MLLNFLFQSRNRESYLFKVESFIVYIKIGLFQSRNRESYLFKYQSKASLPSGFTQRFNLVIESLIFSRKSLEAPTTRGRQFQSRNRESYLFKRGNLEQAERNLHRFNLVIESLIFSSVNVVSRVLNAVFEFQSRNRESYLFKRLS